MCDLSYLKDNIMSRRWKQRYEQCSQEVKDKLDKLDDMLVKDYQLQVIKRKRIYPEIGDIFQIRPRENIEYYGVVINNHVKNIGGDDWIVVFIFNEGVDIKQAVKEGVKKEDLLIYPEIVPKFYWTRGYFFNVDHTEVNNVNNYGFYSIGKCKFLDEYGNDIKKEPYLLGMFGIATVSGIAAKINREMIIRGII